ncbi:MAG: undecaprenyl-diphosphate phosphatase, partial [bacterium]
MTGWEAVLLGIIQGLTEFLPVSSSGHLVLGKAILGIHINGIAFEIVVHFGTLFAVVTVFKNDLIKIFNAFTSSLISKFKTNEVRNSNAVSPDGLHLLVLLIIGTLPGAIFGYLFRSTFESFFTNPQFVSGALLITGIILFISKFAKEKSRQLNYSKSFMIGMVQVGAFFPGISRSGATISAGLLLGIQPIESARFSFLLAVPLILGVSL